MAMSGDRIRERSRWVADRAHLLGIALTMDPLTAGAVPIKRRSGDVRSRADRRTWPMSWRSSDPLLARAADYAGTELRTRARRLIDLRERDGGFPLAARGPAGANRSR
jgi:hypothetical protein